MLPRRRPDRSVSAARRMCAACAATMQHPPRRPPATSGSPHSPQLLRTEICPPTILRHSLRRGRLPRLLHTRPGCRPTAAGPSYRQTAASILEHHTHPADCLRVAGVPASASRLMGPCTHSAPLHQAPCSLAHPPAPAGQQRPCLALLYHQPLLLLRGQQQTNGIASVAAMI